jgi:hypothetical protein
VRSVDGNACQTRFSGYCLTAGRQRIWNGVYPRRVGSRFTQRLIKHVVACESLEKMEFRAYVTQVYICFLLPVSRSFSFSVFLNWVENGYCIPFCLDNFLNKCRLLDTSIYARYLAGLGKVHLTTSTTCTHFQAPTPSFSPNTCPTPPI